MFGLMKNTGCLQSGQPDWYRLHYCGTCKSLGKLYGQRSRLFLNYDIVFLSEILSVLNKEDTSQWNSSLYSKNCFDLPEEKDLPISLQFAADINTILADLKVKDNSVDGVSHLWKLVNVAFKKPFSKIEKRMSHWGIDDSVLAQLQEEDFIREYNEDLKATVSDSLTYHAEPSAKITAYLFSKGAEAIQQPEWKDLIYNIGFTFGELTYGLDAWKDLEKDIEEDSFNPLLKIDSTNDIRKEKAATWLWEKTDQLLQMISQTEIDDSVKESIQVRLQMNMSAALNPATKVCTPKSGIEHSTVPKAFRAFNKSYRQVTAWLNPLRPTRFVTTYMVMLFVFFQQQLFAVVDALKEPMEQGLENLLLVMGVVALPFGLYLVGKNVNENKDQWSRKMKRRQKRLLRRFKRLQKRLNKTDKEGKKKLKWWVWVLIILVALLMLTLLLAILGISSASGSGCSGGGGGCDSGCGDSCEPDCDCG